MNTDIEHATAWLTQLDHSLGSTTAFRSIMATGRGEVNLCRCYRVGDAAEFASILQDLESTGQCERLVVGLGVLAERPAPGRRGCSDDVIAVTCFAVDIDAEKHGSKKSAALEKAMEVAYGLGLPIGAVVDSGHGIHVYIFLRLPWLMATEDDRLAYSERQRFLADAFDGDPITDLARTLRLPGSWNMKDPSKPVLCQVLQFDSEAKVDPEDVPRLAMPVKAKALCRPGRTMSMDTALPDPLPAPEAAKLISRLKRLSLCDPLLRRALSPKLLHTSQSDADYAALCLLLERGLSPRQALHLGRHLRELREGTMSDKNSRDDYWALTLAAAENTTEEGEREDG